MLSHRLGWFGKLDDRLYDLEVVVVVTAVVLMSVIVFTDVVYQLVVTIDQMAQAGDTTAWLYASIVLGFAGLMAFSGAAQRTRDKEGKEGDPQRSVGFRFLWAAGVIVALIALGVMLLTLTSQTVYRLMTIALLVPVARHFASEKQWIRLGVLLAIGVFALWQMHRLPEAYSWAQSYALFLLLWVGFLGASMAARQRRHLRVDLSRKLISPKYLPHFNALSYFTAAVFTAVLLYLGWIYIFGADSTYLKPIWEPPTWLPEATQESLKAFPVPPEAPFSDVVLHVVFSPSQPGEVPDWLKVLAIPISMALILMRFLGHTVAFLLMAARGESFVDDVEVH